MGSEPASAPSSKAPSREDVLAAMDRVLASSDFDASERNRRFLRFVVGETLAGRSDRIKAFAIATTVFGRSADFDPQADPIIRIEAGRLRRSLEHYYLTSGRSDPVRISIPKGSYIPVFEWRRSDLAQATDAGAPAKVVTPPIEGAGRRQRRLIYASAVAAVVAAIVFASTGLSYLAGYPLFERVSGTPTEARRGPAVFVMQFQDESIPQPSSTFSQGFARDVIAGLTRFKELFVFAAETSLRPAPGADMQRIARDLRVDFVLSGGVALTPDRVRVTVTLVQMSTGRHIWSQRFDVEQNASDVLGVREDIANRVVQAIAQPYGAMFVEKAREIEGKPPKSFSSYECVLHFHLYWRKLAAEQYESVRECLERAVARDPDYAEALASLARIYVDAYRFKFDEGAIGSSALPRALDLANRAVELAPNSAVGYKARHLVLWMMQDLPRSIEAARTALDLNPYDTDIMGDLGFRLCVSGDWSAGLPLIREAFARNPAESSAYRVPLALNHYMRGEFRDALAEAQKIDMTKVIYPQILLAITHAQLGHRREASSALQRIQEIDAAYGDHVVADLEKRSVHPSIIRAVVDGLRKAGMSGTDISRAVGS